MVDVDVVGDGVRPPWCADVRGPGPPACPAVQPGATTAAASTTSSSGVRLVDTRPSVARAFPAEPSPFSREPERHPLEAHDDDPSGGRDGEALRRGRAGASARAEYERRQARDEARRRAVFGPSGAPGPAARRPRSRPPRPGAAAPTARSASGTGSTVRSAGAAWSCTTGPSPAGGPTSTTSWSWPSGVWVIDTKHYRGRLERRELRRVVRPPPPPLRGRTRPEPPGDGGAPAAGPGGRGCPPGSRRRSPVRAALCFTGVQSGCSPGPFTLEGVLVTWPRAFARRPGRTGAARPGRAACTGRSRSPASFPPYATPRGHLPQADRRLAQRGSARAGARPTWRAPCAAACRAAACRP